MGKLEGVRIGPLDPDNGSAFGQVAAGNVARQLLRTHAQMYSRDLQRALRIPHHDQRTATLVRAEVEDVVGHMLPKGARVMGFAVHGEDDGAGQYLSFTFQVPRKNPIAGQPDGFVTVKAAIDYEPAAFPKSHAAGDRALLIKKAREDGLPWHPESGILDPPKAVQRERALAETDPEASPDGEASVELRDELEAEREKREEAERERDDLREQLRALSERVSAVEAAGEPEVPGEPQDPAAVTSGTAEGEDNPAEPWPGYENANARDIVQKLREEKNRDQAQLVVAHEQAVGKRGTVLAAAHQVIDETG
jgi:hypothetical protein